MRVVVQRVTSAAVQVEGQEVGRIGSGLLIFLGICKSDTKKDQDYIVEKVTNLRVFPDNSGQMNLSAKDLKKDLLIVSQFTLYGDCRKGRRPSFNQSASGDLAKTIYEESVKRFSESGLKVATGQFQAHMQIEAINDGPVTILLDSEKKF